MCTMVILVMEFLVASVNMFQTLGYRTSMFFEKCTSNMHNSAHCYNRVLDYDQAIERVPISTNSNNKVNASLEINLSVNYIYWTNSPRVIEKCCNLWNQT